MGVPSTQWTGMARPIPDAMRDYSIARKWIGLSSVCLVATFLATLLSLIAATQAQAIPAFARKYDVNCTACHTAPPILNTYDQRFLENGYQLPGTEDGGSTGKKKLGDLNLDDVNQYVGFRLVATRSAIGVSRSRTLPAPMPGWLKTNPSLCFLKISCCSPAGPWPKTLALWSSWAMTSKRVAPLWSGDS